MLPSGMCVYIEYCNSHHTLRISDPTHLLPQCQLIIYYIMAFTNSDNIIEGSSVKYEY